MKRTLAALFATLVLSCPLTLTAQETGTATPAEALKLPPGFKAQLLHTATEAEGSWVCMTTDDKGRLYVSPQGKPTPTTDPLLRITLKPDGTIEKIDKVPLPIGGAMGMLWAFDSLYVSGAGPQGQGIYRLTDTDKDDSLDKATLFKLIPDGAGEHGAHAIVLGPDNHLYIANGNMTSLVEGIAPDSQHRNYKEDYLLPRIMDPVATFFDALKVPYGVIYRVDPEGKKWELFAGGFRNQYDIDFNSAGELFTYDSDMEWDIGLPWYRPTRILHVTSGAEFGFREGNTKWPAYYPDSLGSVVNVGLGCPTGVKFGTKSNFPSKYKSAFFVLDWTYGRILAIHMKAAGASYAATNKLPNPYYLSEAVSSDDVEVFMSGKGMPVNDVEFGKDGSMYVTVGGRGTQAALYRISYAGPAGPKMAAGAMVKEDPQVEIRHKLEAFQGKQDPAAVAAAWTHLGSMDRNVRYAARLALESQPVDQWAQKALDENDPPTALTALLALARMGGRDTQEPLLKALAKFPMDSLNEPRKLDKLRVIELSYIRQGKPSQEMVDTAIAKLSKQYPAESFALNRELSQLLVYLGAPDVVTKSLALMNSSPDTAEQIWFASVIREAKGWTPEQRIAYFTWFEKAKQLKGGNSFSKFILVIHDQAMAQLTEPEKEQVAAALKALPPVASAQASTAPAVARQFQKQWAMADLQNDLATGSTGRNFDRGKEIFSSLKCAACHRFNNEGGGVGPDISAVGNRFGRKDILEAIIDPSKVISEQYASYVVKTKSNEVLSGQIVEENNDHLIVVTDPIANTRVWLSMTQVAQKKVSPVSTMPSGLLDVLSKDEVLDLLSYIESGGKKPAN